MSVSNDNIEKLDASRLQVIQENTGFTIHLNKVCQQLKDPVALAIWCYLTTLPPNWIIHRIQIRQHFGIGRDKLEKAFAILKKCNLLDIHQERNANGSYDEGQIKVYVGYDFEPIPENPGTVISPIPEKPYNGKPGTGKQHLHIKQITNNREIKKRERENLDSKAVNDPPTAPALSLSQTFKPSKELIDYIYTLENLTDDLLNAEHVKFMEYYYNSGKVSSNWEREYKMWMLKASQYYGNKRKSG